MSLQQQLIVAAAVVLAAVAVMRVVRVHYDRAPHPEGRARILFLLTLFFVPPIVLEFLADPTGAGALDWVKSAILYLGALTGFWILMRIAALIVRRLVHGRARPVLLVALVGSQGEPDDLPFDAALSPDLAEILERVDVANAAFPRGPEFAEQIDRPGFRAAWDLLDAATSALEEQIAEQRRLGVGVAYRATETARDARSRLDTLRRMAADHGQAWAIQPSPVIS
jgi:hypothetical protein